jgi:imidazolonepropionase-like amidohydrolase
VAENRILPDGCVEVESGLITNVSPFTGPALPGDIDLGGDWLVPGFLDLHVHPRVPASPADLRAEV